jgi:hypothetical protein
MGCPVIYKGPNRVSPSFHLKNETDPVTEMLSCFLDIRISDYEERAETK